MQDKIPRGSYRRFIAVGLINGAAFYILWTFFVFLFAEMDRAQTLSWAIAWIIGSLVAHFTHRLWTFDARRHVAKTTTGSYVVYGIGLVGSTITFDIVVGLSLSTNLIFLANMTVWGVIDWYLLRRWVFLFTNTENENESSPTPSAG